MIKGALIFLLAWILAYSTVEQECLLMGSFLAGHTVYDCKVRK